MLRVVGLAIFIALFIPSIAKAGIIEVGASASLRTSNIDDFNYQKSVSYTASVSYYFWEMSAIELSYTTGEQELSVMPSGDSQTITKSTFQLYGADIVFNLADRKATFQPFVKAGAAHIKKELSREDVALGVTTPIPGVEGTVPSAGVGFRLRVTQQFSVKVGVDAWTSPLDEEEETIDYAGRAGISFMF